MTVMPFTPQLSSEDAVELVMAMMAVPGVSGRETAIIQFVTDTLQAAGVPGSAIHTDSVHEQSPFGGEIGNLIVTLDGTFDAPRRLLVAHVDTVPVCEGAQPVRDGNVITSSDPTTGLGADNRSGAAAVLTACIEIHRQHLPHPPVTFFFPVQEEVGLIGARYVAFDDLGRPELGFNWDSGDSAALVIGATGAYRMEIEVDGLASHAGVHPEDGVSAIVAASRAIASLHDQGWLGAINKDGSSGTANIGEISGGEATNVVASGTRLTAEVRSHERVFRDQILDAFKQAFSDAAAGTSNSAGRQAVATISERLDYESFRLGDDAPVVTSARAAVDAAAGRPPLCYEVNGGMDANWLTARGVPTVTLGAGQHGAHTVEEALYVQEFLEGCQEALFLACGADLTDN